MNTKKIDPQVFSSPMTKVYENGGNYDAIGGVISNMDYKLNEDGGFDCSTIITTVGINLFESKRIDKENDDFVTKQSDGGTTVDNDDNIINAILNLPRILVHDYMGIPIKQDPIFMSWDEMFNGRTLNQYIDQRRDVPDEKYQKLLNKKPEDFLGNVVDDYLDEVISTNTMEDGARVGSSRAAWFTSNTMLGDIVADLAGYKYPRDNYVLVKAGDYLSGDNNSGGENPQKVDVVISKLTVADKVVEYKIMAGNNLKSRHDMFVRWGWFEDNILSRYTSYVDNENELFNVFRSIEPELDANNKVVYDEENKIKMRDVRILNDPDYLLPIDPLKFILTGQAINSDYLSLQIGKRDLMEDSAGDFSQPLSPAGQTVTDTSLLGTYLTAFGQNYDFLTAQAFDKLMSINHSNEYSYHNHGDIFEASNAGMQSPNPEADARTRPWSDMKYGILRNVMINVKEIQKAFGIEGIDDYSNPGELFGSDLINPPVGVKEAMKRLCDAFSANFNNYWKFEIVEDPVTKNIKVIDSDSTESLNSKRYTKFNNQPEHIKISKLGIYKFPSFKNGSFVKNQTLEFKIPDSMALTAMYGSTGMIKI